MLQVFFNIFIVPRGRYTKNSRLWKEKIDFQKYKYTYKMNSLPRGFAFIINNEEFEKPLKLSKRNGTNFDAEGLHKLFNALEFESQIYDNVTVEQMKNLCDHFVKKFDHNYDCIICAILTHGKEGKLYGVDGTIEIKELTEKFQVEKLKGKPKLFFFQACQGK